MNKKGELLVENIVFIILNLVFLSILVVFLISQGSGAALMEDAYSKQIALLVDSAKPGMIIKLNMQEALKAAKKNGVNFNESVKMGRNFVTVSLTPDSQKTYSFFNDVSVSAYPDIDDGYNGIYVITVSRQKANATEGQNAE